jgi:hypothetical protein
MQRAGDAVVDERDLSTLPMSSGGKNVFSCA